MYEFSNVMRKTIEVLARVVGNVERQVGNGGCLKKGS